MNNALFQFKRPENEPVYGYMPGSIELKLLQEELKRQCDTQLEIPILIGGKEVKTGKLGKVVMPHNHRHILATFHMVGEQEVRMAVDAAQQAHNKWANLPWI